MLEAITVLALLLGPGIPEQAASEIFFEEVVDCSTYTYERSSWGDHPSGSALGSILRWSTPSDNLKSSSPTVDHHVSIKDAHLSGGCVWSEKKKNEFANDRDNLNTVAKSFNSSKGSRTVDDLTGIAKRVIDTRTEQCDYATQTQHVKSKWQLIMSAAEKRAVNAWLKLCE